MKSIKVTLFGIFLLFFTGCASHYNAKLARSLGADDYGMKKYVLVILKTGTNMTTDKLLLDSLFKGHMASIRKLSDEGKMIVAGPLQKNENNYRGIFVLNVKDVAEAKILLENDPTIREGIFEVELYDWYGSAALPEYLKIHSKIEKKSH